ncbi:GntR family transcriptional regulator [Paenibacillus pinihumi]|uniref:GntR family transcriptional regulator n=1 Tax=Paenibacillus pinihumi TaxID=669462 RepID=UPI00041A49CC|nr:GntR family transcriptional regulator [Paenibacillus pinihumi]
MAGIQLPIQISEHSREPIYHQIEQQLISFIVSGHLKPGMPLPSIRALASDLSCSVITVNRAYQNLEQRKFIETVQGKGTFVANIQAEEKQHVADESLHQAFRAAVEMSLRLQNDEARTRETFEKVLAEILKERGINR